MKAPTLLLRLGIVLLILGLPHLYIFQRLKSDGSTTQWLLAIVLTLALGSIVLRVMLFKRLSERWAALLTRPVYVWMGTAFLLLTVLAFGDLSLGLLSLTAAVPVETLSVAEASQAGVSMTLAGTLVAWAMFEARGPRTQRIRVQVQRLPAELSGLRIVQLSDVHIGHSLRHAFLQKVISQVNDLDPDLVVITGDLVDGPVEQLASHLTPLKSLRSRYGTFFVTGNHEYYAGAEPWCEYLRSLGVVVLRNSRVSIGEDNASFDLAGVDDLSGHQFSEQADAAGHGTNLSQALHARDERRALVLLAHQPRMLDAAKAAGVDLLLSGHTHGGQIWPFHHLVRLQQPVNAGLHRSGGTQIYVSRGTGYWGPPMRLGAPPEVTLLTLES